MTQSLLLDGADRPPVGRPARAVLAAIATLVVVAVLALVELGALTCVAIASSAMNHGGS